MLRVSIQPEDNTNLEGVGASLDKQITGVAGLAAQSIRDTIASAISANTSIGFAELVQSRTRLSEHDGHYDLFIGLDPVKPPIVGEPYQTGRGAQVGPFHFEGGFVNAPRARPEYRTIFKRLGLPRYPIRELSIGIEEVTGILDSVLDDAADNAVRTIIEQSASIL